MYDHNIHNLVGVLLYLGALLSSRNTMSRFIDGQDPPTKSWQMPKAFLQRPKSAKTVDPFAVSSLGGSPL